MEKKITVYTQDNCKYCPIVKNFLEDKGLDFEVRNLSDNSEYKDQLKELGFYSVPVTIINGAPVVGFDIGKLNRLLA